MADSQYHTAGRNHAGSASKVYSQKRYISFTYNENLLESPSLRVERESDID